MESHVEFTEATQKALSKYMTEQLGLPRGESLPMKDMRVMPSSGVLIGTVNGATIEFPPSAYHFAIGLD